MPRAFWPGLLYAGENNLKSDPWIDCAIFAHNYGETGNSSNFFHNKIWITNLFFLSSFSFFALSLYEILKQNTYSKLFFILVLYKMISTGTTLNGYFLETPSCQPCPKLYIIHIMLCLSCIKTELNLETRISFSRKPKLNYLSRLNITELVRNKARL